MSITLNLYYTGKGDSSTSSDNNGDTETVSPTR